MSSTLGSSSGPLKIQRYPRRNFLAWSTVSAGLIALDACSSLEGAFQPDRSHLGDEVVIVGGGLAGLAAAYYLKQNKVRFRLFEADRRMGGRLRSEELGTTHQIIELGGEWIQPQHGQILQLIKELGLSTEEYVLEASSNQSCFFWQNRFWTFAEIKAQSGNFFELARKIRGELTAGQMNAQLIYSADKIPEMARFYNKISLRSLGDKYAEKMGPAFIAYLQILVENHFGQTGEEISVYDFMRYYFGFAGQDLWYTQKQRLLRVVGGNQKICRALEDRVTGVIPDYLVRRGMALTHISYNEPYYSLKFESSLNGELRTYEAKNVILALPISCLQAVRGFRDLPLRGSLQSAIQEVQYAQHSMLFWGLKERVGKVGNLNRIPIFSDLNNSCLYLPADMKNGKDQVIGAQRVNWFRKGLSLQESIAELEFFDKDVRRLLSAEVQTVNWGHHPWSRGSLARIRSGKYFDVIDEFNKADINDSLQLVGEHTSLNYFNTMEGAVGSGKMAAEKILARLRKKSS